MSRWSEQFQTHPFQASWINLSTGAATVALPDGADLGVAEELARLRNLIDHLSTILTPTDPDLAVMDALGAMHQTAKAAVGEVQAFRDENRFPIVIAKTSSDHRAGMNATSEIGRILF